MCSVTSPKQLVIKCSSRRYAFPRGAWEREKICYRYRNRKIDSDTKTQIRIPKQERGKEELVVETQPTTTTFGGVTVQQGVHGDLTKYSLWMEISSNGK